MSIHLVSLTAALLLCLAFCGRADAQGFVNALCERGFSLIPAPQEVSLGGGEVIVNGSWSLESQAGANNIALRSLVQGARKLHQLEFSQKGTKKIVLRCSVLPWFV
jgi:hypothetical protein